jgi:hypothetical protein
VDLREIKKLVNLVKKTHLKESGFSRVRQIMLGQVPSVDTVAILTAENPGGEKAPSFVNKKLTKQFKDSLRDSEHGYTDIAGKFGEKENSFMIMNISRDDTIQLGEEFEQYAVIWGNKLRDDDGEPFFRFEYIEGSTTAQTRDVSLSGKSVEDREDYYSEKRGRKFIIPFFDDKYELAKIKSGRLSFTGAELPKTKEAEDLAESIILRDERLRNPRGMSRKYLWHHRSILREEMKKLEKLIAEV